MLLPALRSLTMHDLATYGVPGLLRIRIQGTRALPREGPVLLLANRASMLDPWMLALAAGRPVHTAASSPLFWLPGLGDLANRVNVVPLLPEEALSVGASARRYAEALDKGLPVVLFTEHMLEPRPEGPRMTVAPAFLDVLLATRSDRIPVVPLRAVGKGRRIQLDSNPLVAPLLQAGARVLDTPFPPVLYTENALRVGSPVYWRDGGGTSTLQAFRRTVEDSLGALF